MDGLSIMNHTQIRAFHAVARLGGFSRAAEALHLTQPAVSEQVRRLEQAHDLRLFHRHRKRVRLTEAGSRLQVLTRRYFEIEDEIDAFLVERAAAMSGRLRIHADSARHITDILTRFRRRHPDVRIELRPGNTGTILEALRNWAADIGVVGQVPGAADLDSLDLGSTPIIAFAARGVVPPGVAAMTMRDLSGYPLVLREPGSATRRQVLDRAEALGIGLDVAIEAEGRDAVRDLVLSGGGVGFVSRAEHSPDPDIVAIEVTDLGARMAESIVHLSQRRNVRLIRRFMEFARRAILMDPVSESARPVSASLRRAKAPDE